MLGRAVRWVLRGVLNSLARHQSAPANQQPAASARRLVRDPVCGVHIAEERALALRVGNEIVHFCSVTCRDQYVATEQKFAANG